jgi:uncharacterized phiE125 gp8 family phage protein
VYGLDSTSLPARIYLKEGQSWPTDTRPYNAIKCVWAAGYASAAAVPYDLKHAIKLLTAHWFELREPVNIGNISSELALMVKPLISPYRIGATFIW